MEFGVAIAQRNFVVGDIPGNEKRIVDSAIDARDSLKCRFVVFPELSICGYPPEDLLYRSRFVHECEQSLNRIAEQIRGIAVVVGHPHQADDKLYNAASVVDDGSILATYRKYHLPNYGVFDEKRYFNPGDSPTVIEIDGITVGITICEDVWEDGPVEWSVESGAQLIFTLNGSPFDTTKIDHRENRIVAERAKRNNVAIVYANLVGGQDELVFDGGSLVSDESGKVVMRASHFRELNIRSSFKSGDQIRCIGGEIAPIPGHLEAIYKAVTLGTGDYIRKNGFRQAILGLSGGIDSALTLAIVADAIGPENVQAVLMPSRYTRQMSLDDAISQADQLGVSWSVISIESVYQAFLNLLAEEFEDCELDITEENIQARCRGILLMSISNKKGKILITTGNKSEVGCRLCNTLR